MKSEKRASSARAPTENFNFPSCNFRIGEMAMRALTIILICIVFSPTVLVFVPGVRAASADIMLVSRELDNSTQNLGTITVEPENPPYPPVPNLPRVVTRDTDPLPYQVFFIPPSRHVIHHWEYSGGIYIQDASMPLPLVNMYVNSPGPAQACAVYEEIPANVHLESLEIDSSTSNLGTMDFTGATSLSLPSDLQRMASGSPYQATFYPPPQHDFDHWECTGGIQLLDPNVGSTCDVWVSYDGTLRAVYKPSPLPPYDATIAAFCHVDGIDPGVSISPGGDATPHTFTGLTGANQFTVPSVDPGGHVFRRWNTGESISMIEVDTAGVYTAEYEANQRPIAVLDVDPDPPIVYAGTEVWFYGDGSSDPDGDQVVAFFFDFGDDKDSGWLNYPTWVAKHPYVAAGQYSARMMVKDAYGLESEWSDSIEVTILSAPGSPIAILEVSSQLEDIGIEITFDASQSSDSDGWIEDYGFDYGNGVIEWTTGSTVEYSYPDVGDFSARVLVSDNSGLETWSSPIDIVITRFPVADFSYEGPETSFTPDMLYERSLVQFSASSSYDIDGTIVSYYWDLGDGVIANEVDTDIEHLYISSGPYVVTLTVTDNKGATDSISKNIFINPLKWEIYFEIDYMEGHEPTDSVLEYIHGYFRDNGIYVYFFVDDEILVDPVDPGVTNAEFWQYEQQNNDVWRFDDRANGNKPNPPDARYKMKEKWILFGNVDLASGFNYNGYTWPDGTDAGNYIFIADQKNDNHAATDPDVTSDQVETVVLMHEIGHSIGIIILNNEGKEVYDADWTSVMSSLRDDNCRSHPIHYSEDYWDEKNLNYYTISGSSLRIAAHSPVNILVTDPFGRRVGYDNGSGETVNEIPGANYSGPGIEPQEIYIPEPLHGDYLVQTFGTGSGLYEIRLESIVNGSIIDIDSWESTISLGEEHHETCRLDTDGDLMLPHDIEVTSLLTERNILEAGPAVPIEFSVENSGSQSEIFNITIFINDTIVTTFANITLIPGASTNLTCIWNSTGYVKGNYTIRAEAEPVSGEQDTYDNIRFNWILVTILGDVDGNREVEIFDIIRMAIIYGMEDDDPTYEANCDLDGDGDIDIFDIVAAAGNYGESW